MKKLHFFAIFLLIATVFTFCPKQIAYGELNGYTINIFAQFATDSSSNYSDCENFDAITKTLSDDYSSFGTDGSIIFTGQAVATGEENSSTLAYEWKTSSGEVLTNSSSLILYKKAQTQEQPLIMIGETKYVLTITNSQDSSYSQIVVTTKITDTSSSCKLLTYAPTIPAEVNSSSDNLSFSAKLPIVNGSVINWYLKTPNSSSFNLVKSNVENYVFTTSSIVNNLNGFGTYKLMAIAYNKNTKNYYYSETFKINGAETAKTVIQTDYTINIKKVDNTKANIEAFHYTLNNSANLNEENIFWYINSTRMHTGASFTYEPLNTEAYKIIAKYQKADGTLIELSNIKQEPATTGTYILIIYIGIAVVILSAILATSIIITNKKRDVVW